MEPRDIVILINLFRLENNAVKFISCPGKK